MIYEEESEIMLVKSIDRNTKQRVLEKAGQILQIQFHLMTLLYENGTINVKKLTSIQMQY